MKSTFIKGFTVLMLLLSLANCGKSGGSSNNNPNTYYPYNSSYYPNDYNNVYNQQYGYRPGGGNWCQAYNYGCTYCQYPVYQGCSGGYGCTGGYQMGYQAVVYDPRNYYGRGNSWQVQVGFGGSTYY